MNNLDITNIGTFIHDNQGEIFSICRYKKVYTPYEIENKFIDESIYEETYTGIIRKAIEIPNDVLLEIEQVFENLCDIDNKEDTKIVSYERLSNIVLFKMERSN